MNLSSLLRKKLFPYFFLAILNLIVWYQALFVTFRNDQWWNFYHVNFDPHNLWYLIQQMYSLPRTIYVLPNNNLLFRPLTGIAIAINQWLFGYNYIGWNFVSIFVHVFTSFLIYYFAKLYLSKNKSLSIASLFSVSFANVEMITWSHIVGYNLFIASVLISIILLKKYIYTKKLKYFLLNSLVLLICPFFVELGIFVVLIEGMWMLIVFQNHFKRIVLSFSVLSGILFSWIFLNYLDYYYNLNETPSIFTDLFNSTSMDNISIFLKIFYTFDLYGRYILLTFAPFFQEVVFSGLVLSGNFQFPVFPSLNLGTAIPYIVMILSLGIFLFLIIEYIYNIFKIKKVEAYFEIPIILISLSFIGFITLVNKNQEYIRNQRLHYSYLLNVLIFTFLPILLFKTNSINHLKKYIHRRVLFIIFGLLIIMNILSVKNYVQNILGFSKVFAHYIHDVQGIIDCYEKKFAQGSNFQIVHPPNSNMFEVSIHPITYNPMTEKAISVSAMYFTATDILFKEYKKERTDKLFIFQNLEENQVKARSRFYALDSNCTISNAYTNHINFSSNGNSILYKGFGWKSELPNGTNTFGNQSELYIPIKNKKRDLELAIHISEVESPKKIWIYSEQLLISEFEITKPDVYKILIPKKYFGKTDTIPIQWKSLDLDREKASLPLFLIPSILIQEINLSEIE